MPPAPYDRYYLGRLFALLGRYDEAAAAIAFRPPSDAGNPLYLGLEGALAAHRGASSAVAEADGRLAAMTDPTFAPVVAIQRARIAAAGGDRTRAIELLETASQQGMVRVPIGLDLHIDWIFDPLRGDPRFEAINRGRD